MIEFSLKVYYQQQKDLETIEKNKRPLRLWYGIDFLD